jgi:hypothetical protein
VATETHSFGSAEDVNRVWDLITRAGIKPGRPHRVQFSIACPNRPTGEFLAQYLSHSAGFAPAPLHPLVSEDGEEYWDLEVVSFEGSLSLAFLLQVCSTVHAATTRFGCRLYAWGRAHEPDQPWGGLTSA